MHAVRQKDFNRSALTQHAILKCDQNIEWNLMKKTGQSKRQKEQYRMEAIKTYEQGIKGLSVNKRDDSQNYTVQEGRFTKLHCIWKEFMDQKFCS